MSYITDIRPAAHYASMANPVSAAGRDSLAVPVHPVFRAATRLSEALEITVLVATLSGISLVLSTVAAGAF